MLTTAITTGWSYIVAFASQATAAVTTFWGSLTASSVGATIATSATAIKAAIVAHPIVTAAVAAVSSWIGYAASMLHVTITSTTIGPFSMLKTAIFGKEIMASYAASSAWLKSAIGVGSVGLKGSLFADKYFYIAMSVKGSTLMYLSLGLWLVILFWFTMKLLRKMDPKPVAA